MTREWKKVVLYAIGPAIIAGLFAVAPKLYDLVTEPTAELTYSIISGPELRVTAGYRRILSIVVSNSGKKALSSVTGKLELDIGQVEAKSVQEESGLNPVVTAGVQEISVGVAKLHPGEQFALSAMILLPRTGVNPQFTLRSQEVLGKVAEERPERRESTLGLVGAGLASLSVFLMATMVILRRTSLTALLGPEKQDVLFYISARLNLPAISNEMRLVETSLSYLRMADILLAHGLTATGEEKSNTIRALKCLLLIGDIAETSLAVIVNNLKTLERNDFSEDGVNSLRGRAISVKDQMTLRKEIDQLVEDNVASIPNTDTEA